MAKKRWAWEQAECAAWFRYSQKRKAIDRKYSASLDEVRAHEAGYKAGLKAMRRHLTEKAR